MDSMYYWLIFGVFLLVAEIMVPGVFLVFFGMSALLAGLLDWLFPELHLSVLILVFVIGGVVAMLLTKKYFPKICDNKEAGKNIEEDDVVGKFAVVTEEIRKNHAGKVSFRGSFWTAESEETLPVGTEVKIVSRNNITLIVTK